MFKILRYPSVEIFNKFLSVLSHEQLFSETITKLRSPLFIFVLVLFFLQVGIASNDNQVEVTGFHIDPEKLSDSLNKTTITVSLKDIGSNSSANLRNISSINASFIGPWHDCFHPIVLLPYGDKINGVYKVTTTLKDSETCISGTWKLDKLEAVYNTGKIEDLMDPSTSIAFEVDWGARSWTAAKIFGSGFLVLLLIYFVLYYERTKMIDSELQKLKEEDKSNETSSTRSEAEKQKDIENEKRLQDQWNKRWRIRNFITSGPDIAKSLYKDEYNSPSASRAQFLIWTTIAIYAYVVISADKIVNHGHFDLTTEFPYNLILAMGISSGTFLLSRQLTKDKRENIDSSKQKWPEGNKGGILLDDRGEFDAAKVQMIAWTIVAAGGYLILVTHNIRTDFVLPKLPDIDPSLVALMGIGDLAYLGKKAITDPTEEKTDTAKNETNPVKNETVKNEPEKAPNQ